MSWAFDAQRYRAEVLEPAFVTGKLPTNLFQRYQLPEDADDPTSATALDEVRRHLNQRALKAADKYKTIAKRLLDDHERARATLATRQKRDPYRRDLDTIRTADEQRFGEILADLKRERGRFLPPARLDRLRGEFGSLGEAQVRRQVAGAGLVVRDPRPLPSHPGLANHRALVNHLRTLEHDHVLDFLFDEAVLGRGFRLLDGFEALADPRLRLDTTRVDRVEAAWATRARDDRSAAANAVIGLLRQVLKADPDEGIRRLALYQLAGALRSLRDHGLPPSTLAHEARRRGLAGGEAAELAYAVSEEGAARDTTAEELRAALGARQLRHAELVVEALPAGVSDPEVSALAEQVRRAIAEVERLRTHGDRLRAEGDLEGAARALGAAAQRVADDPTLDDALRRCPPARPASARARVSGKEVVVEWAPSPSTAGAITYSVVRAAGRPPVAPGDGHRVGDLESGPAVDPAPPPGVELYYGVFTWRDAGVASGSPALTNAVVVASEVEGLSLSGGDSVIEGAWRLPPPAVGPRIVRSAGRPPRDMDDGQVVPASGQEFFRDEGLDPGVTHYYRVAAVYLTPGGTKAISEGLVRAATLEAAPVPVTDLRAMLEEGAGGVVLTWSPPPAGEVRVLVSASPPGTAPGSVVAGTNLEALGTAVAAVARRRADGSMELSTSQTVTRAYYTAVTLSGSRAGIGTTCALTSLPPVSDLQFQPFLGEIRLLWTWPPNCSQVLVCWREGSPPTGAHDTDVSTQTVSFQEYRTEGGVRLRLPNRAHGVTVFTTALVEGRRHHSRPASLEHVRPLGGIEVTYELVRARSRGRRRLAVRLAGPGAGPSPGPNAGAGPASQVPEFVLVAGREARPLGPDDGEVLLRIPAGTAPGALFRLPEVPERCYLRGFLVGPDAGEFLLRHPSARQLRVGLR